MRYVFVVAVETDSAEHAEKVMEEHTYSEGRRFGYTVEYMPFPETVRGSDGLGEELGEVS